MYTYAQVERALAAVHEVPEAAMGAFRGRFKHFQRLGMVPSSPGRGRKIVYSLDDVYFWALCLQLEEFGLDPTKIKAFYMLDFRHIVSMLVGDKSKKYWVFSPNFLSQWYSRPDLALTYSRPDLGTKKTLWETSGCFVDDLSEIDQGSGPVFDVLRKRSASINLGWLRAAIAKSLPALPNVQA
jgi:hypothetical protein